MSTAYDNCITDKCYGINIVTIRIHLNMKVDVIDEKVSRANVNKQSFYESVRKTLFVSKIVGLLPIEGLFDKNSNVIRKSWSTTSKITYGLNLLLCFLSFGNMFINVIFSNENRSYVLVELLVRTGCLILMFNLYKFSNTWRRMLLQIEQLERLLPRSNRRKYISVNRVIAFMFSLGIFDYIVNLVFMIRMLCVSPTRECSLYSFYDLYYRWAFKVIPFSYVATFCLQVAKFQRSFLVVFLDTLVVSVTLYLLNKFEDFNQMFWHKIKHCDRYRHSDWTHTQAHYTRLSRLVTTVDDNYNSFIFMSFAMNLIYLIRNIHTLIMYRRHKYQIAGLGLVSESDWIVIFYLTVNTITIISKALITSGTVVYLHTLSREPLNALHTVPASAYNLQFQRFMDQVYRSSIHLTGLGMFKISRGTVFSVISALITYELILVQLPDYNNVE